MTRKPEFRRAGRFWSWFLDRNNAVAIYLPWRVVYYTELDDDTIRHESVHDAQRLRDGFILFTVRYWWWHFRYGYDNNPYEIEAYASK